MRAVLDACVLYPTVLREILIGAARAGLYRPIWSARILEEWARAAARRNAVDETFARGEIALLRAEFPKAEIAAQPGLESRLHLPDENDIHVLAVAIAGHADAIVTANRADFPRGTLAGEGLERRDPDGFLWQLLSEHPEQMRAITETVRAEAERLSGQPQPIRALMKRARLPRFGKALAG
jgi:predicted nucleic acid-binding protein